MINPDPILVVLDEKHRIETALLQPLQHSLLADHHAPLQVLYRPNSLPRLGFDLLELLGRLDRGLGLDGHLDLLTRRAVLAPPFQRLDLSLYESTMFAPGTILLDLVHHARRELRVNRLAKKDSRRGRYPVNVYGDVGRFL